MLRGAKLAAALSKVALISVHGPWSRIVGFRHMLDASHGRRGARQPLWGGAAAIKGARFTPKGGFASLYLAGDPVTAFVEIQALVIVPGGVAHLRTAPTALLTVDGIVSNVLDLTDAKTLGALSTTAQEMTGAWVKGSNPPTQELGRRAYDSGKIRAIRYGSAKHPSGVNLVVFPDRLVSASTDFLEVYDPHGNLTQRIGR